MNSARLLKLLTLLMHDSAMAGEAAAAATRLVAVLKNSGLSPWEVSDRLSIKERPQGRRNRKSMSSSPVKFGKYRGRLWKHVAEEDPTYLYWVLDNFEDLYRSTRIAINDALEECGYPTDGEPVEMRKEEPVKEPVWEADDENQEYI